MHLKKICVWFFKKSIVWFSCGSSWCEWWVHIIYLRITAKQLVTHPGYYILQLNWSAQNKKHKDPQSMHTKKNEGKKEICNFQPFDMAEETKCGLSGTLNRHISSFINKTHAYTNIHRQHGVKKKHTMVCFLSVKRIKSYWKWFV